MKTEKILELFDLDERQGASIPGMRRERDGSVIRLVMEAEDEGRSFVVYSDLNEENADAEIARQVAFFRDLGRDFEWPVHGHDRPADLAQRLLAHGFEAEETEALMVLELADLPPRLREPQTADIRQITAADDLEPLRQLLQDVWDEEFTWFKPRMARLLQTDTLAIFAAYEDELPVSAAWVFLPPNNRFAGMYGGSTLEAYRGRGLYTALVAARAQEALRRGYQFLTVDAGDMSRPIVEKQGFRLLTTSTPLAMTFK